MDLQLLNRLRELQRIIREEGLGGTVISVPESKLAISQQDGFADSHEDALFSQLILEEEIVSVSRDLFESGFFNQAVDEAFKALEIFIRHKSGFKGSSGAELIRLTFSPDQPRLVWSTRETNAQRDEQSGYFQMYNGGFVGIRNPVRDEANWISDKLTALEYIFFAQHLLRKAKVAFSQAPPQKSVI